MKSRNWLQFFRALSLLVAFLFSGSFALAAHTGSKNGTVVIIRHGEKDEPTAMSDRIECH